jgi:sugar phosphate isomerase/epimerase
VSWTRRQWLGAAAAAALPAQSAQAARQWKIAVFSKHLQFLRGDTLAAAALQAGFDGVDITVRHGGHVEPVTASTDLPPLVALLRKSGLEVPMVTSGILDASTPGLEEFVRLLAGLGIRYYRWDGFQYDPAQPFPPQLDDFRRRSSALAALNARHGVMAIYHTHSGMPNAGAAIVSLREMFHDADPRGVGLNFDIAHATIEGGLAGWIQSFRLCQERIHGVAVKDFVWSRNARGEWDVQWTPLGAGMVHLGDFAAMLRASAFAGPIQLHAEYPLGGAENGRREISIPPAAVIASLQHDCAVLRAALQAT